MLKVDETPGADELCQHCGHLFDEHRLYGYVENPTGGWMDCPVEGCNCEMTWSADYSASDKVEGKL